MDHPIKITVAADEVGVSYKTIYNWVADGSLPLAGSGYVYLADVQRVQLEKQEHRTRLSKENTRWLSRDSNGRFKLLSGKFNGKS